MRKTLAILMILCLAFGSTGALAADSPAAVMERCAQAMEQVGSFAAKGTLTVGVKGLVNSAVYDALSAEVFVEPLKVHILFEAMGAKIEAYAEEVDGKLHLHAKTGFVWDTQALDVAELFSAETGPVLPAEELHVERTQLADGREALRLSADIDLRQWLGEEEIQELIGQTMGVQAVGVYPPYEPVIVQIAAFVEVETGYLARVEIDLSQISSAVLTMLTPSQPGMESAPLEAEVKIGLDLFDWNTVADFEIPAEAKAQ